MSVRPTLLVSAVLLGFGTFSASSDAQVYYPRSPFDTCNTCRPVQPVVVNPCATCLETTLVPRQQVSYQNVTETRYRQEAIATQVPITRYQQVTRDEGGYQMVWVPKMVTRQQAQTVYEQRLTTRTVPYSVTTQIPQVHTVYQPQTIVRGYYGTPIVSQPIQLYPPVPRTAALPSAIPAVQPYSPAPSSSKLPPSNPKALDLKQLDSASPAYDDQSQSSMGRAPNRKYIQTSASVFRRYQ